MNELIFNGFEWDDGNQDKNLKKHGVNCEEIEETFLGKKFVFQDSVHSTNKEERFVLFGESFSQKRLFVAFTLRSGLIRVISARPMSKKERMWYEEAKKKK